MKLFYKISLALNSILFVVLLGAAVFGKKIVKHIVTQYIINPRKEQKQTMFQACPISKGAIIFLGNSITEGGNFAELFPEKNILNRGIGGDITSGVLARMDEILRHQPSKLFIDIGTNDLAMGMDNNVIMDNYENIVGRVREQSPNTKIYVQSLLPIGKNSILPHKNEKIIPLNTEIELMCKKKEITYIDLHSHFIDSEGYLKTSYSNDNLHLLGPAYLVWRDVIEKYVNE